MMRIEDAPDRDFGGYFGWVIGEDTQIDEELQGKEVLHPCFHANCEEAMYH